MKEASLGKITRKYFFKVFIWFLLIEIICGIAVMVSFGSKIDGMSSPDLVETFEVVNGLIKALILVNIFACVIPPLLATRKIKKKFIINEENKKKVFRNVAIILVIMAVLLIGIHAGIRGYIFNESTKSTKITEKKVREGLKDLDEFAKENDILEDEADMMKKFMTLTDIYVADGIIFVLMIGCEYFFIMKKEQKVKEE